MPGSKTQSATPAASAASVNVATNLKDAQLQRLSGDFDGAARTLSQLVVLAPEDARVLGEYGKTLLAQGRSDDAVAFLTRVTELDPGDWSALSALGVAYDQKGDYPKAQSAYGRALALKPGDPTVLSNDALSHIQSGDLEEAERLLLQAEAHATEFPRIASNLALVRSLKSSRPASPPRAPAPLQPVAEAAQPSPQIPAKTPVALSR
jgi:Flp pilus assembly protein TadD